MKAGPLATAVVVLGLAAFLRFGGIGWLLPVFVEPDVHVATQVRLMDERPDDAERQLAWSAYPQLVARLAWLLTPREAPPGREPAALDEQLARARWPVLRARIAVALLSLLALPATYLVARVWLSAAWSLLAAALTATSLLAVHFAAQARPHGAAVALMALAVAACVRLRSRGDWSSYVLAGLAVAAAMGCLQSGAVALVPLLAAHFGAAKGQGPGRHARLLLPTALIALGLAAFAPDWRAPFAVSHDEIDAGPSRPTHRLDPSEFNGRGFLLLARTLWSWEPALVCGAVLGIAVWLGSRTRLHAAGPPPPGRNVVLAFALPYLGIAGLFEYCFERYVLPLVPFLAVLATWGLATLCGRLRASSACRVATAALGLALLAFPTLVVVRLVSARSAPATSDLAADWLRAHVAPAGAPSSQHVLLSPWLDLPVFRQPGATGPAPQSVDQGLGWRSYQSCALFGREPSQAWSLSPITTATLGETLAEVTRDPAAWVSALPAELCMIDARPPAGPGTWNRVTAALRQNARLVTRISPDGDPQAYDEPLWYQDRLGESVAPMAWRVLHAERLGPVIEIYALPAADRAIPER